MLDHLQEIATPNRDSDDLTQDIMDFLDTLGIEDRPSNGDFRDKDREPDH